LKAARFLKESFWITTPRGKWSGSIDNAGETIDLQTLTVSKFPGRIETIAG